MPWVDPSLLVWFSWPSLPAIIFLTLLFLVCPIATVEDSTVAGLIRFPEQLDQWFGISLDGGNSF